MSQTTSARPRRRANVRSKQILDSDDEDRPSSAEPTHDNGSVDDKDLDDFTPAPQLSTRKVSARRTAKTLSPAMSMDLETNEDVENESPASQVPPAKQPVASGRRSIRAGRKSLAQLVPDKPAPLPTPQPSASPEPHTARASPLADITEDALNLQPEQDLKPAPALESSKPVNVSRPLEKPMDIVVRTRAKGVPQVHMPTEPRARMVITYLILDNFKSYAGRQEVGPFHASFSSVVGPNGSGKSNVIDSLLFVFGFRASKMRQGKISSLIHNSAAHPDLEYCEVQVHFQKVIDQNSAEKQVVPDSNVIVSRRAFRNNSSKYYINGAESNFTTVTTMLREEGIDLDHKRFLILQGEVESIAQMKPKAANEHDDGLLEYLEDIIGTSKYKTPIEEASTELESFNEVCREKSARVEHVDREKSGLEGKKNAALAYVNDENDLAEKQSALWQIFVHECEDNIQVTSEAVTQQQEQLDAEAERHRGSEQEISSLNKKYSTEAKQLEKIQQSAQAVSKQLAKADKESVKFDEKGKHLAAKLRKLEKAASTSQSAISESRAYLDRLTEDLQRNMGTVKGLEQDLADEEANLASVRESLKGKTQGLSDQITLKQRSLEPWHEQINDKRSAIAVAQSELDMLRERENSNAQALVDLEGKLKQLERDQESKAQLLRDLSSQKDESQSTIIKTQKTMDRLAAQEPEARAKLSSSRQKIDEAKASISTAQTQGNVLGALMRLKDSGRISGFHGRLGNLGAIDEQFDVAISTACPALDNLVVDTVEVGQQCIDFLRKGNLGRANFILLDRLGHRDMSTVQTPEGVPRLFDLVKPKDERFLPAFYSVLQNTLVAENLEQANRVAYGAKRWRVVTLDGKLIDKSGTMSGGGTRTAKGAMSSKIVAHVSKDQVSRLEKEHEQEERKWHDFQDEQRALAASLKAARDRVPALETQMQKCSLEADSFRGNIQDTEKRLAELKGAQNPHEPDTSHVDSLGSTIRRHEAEIQKLAQNTQGLEEEVKALQEKIMEIGGVKLRGQKAKVDGLKEQLTTLNEEIANAEIELSKTEKAKTKHEKSLEASQKEVASVQSDVERLEEDVKEQGTNMSGIRKEAEDAQEILEAKQEEIAALKADVDRRTAELNESRGAEIDMRNRLEENQKALNENTKRLKYWQEKLGKLTLQNISDIDASVEEQSPSVYSRDELTDLDKNLLKGEIAALEEKTQNANVDLGVLAEYRRRVEELTSRSSDLAEAVAQRDTAKKRSEDLRRIRLEGFMEGFSTISLRLKEMYQMITMGGNAELELVDSLDPFSEGILFSVMPPKKSWKNISNLSGGEKTLSSLALVFALHHYKPTPLYVMDEIDAALDFRNVSIVASYIKERTKNAQFIVISLRNNMFELASRLVGVYKVNHMTKSVTVENQDYMERSR